MSYFNPTALLMIKTEVNNSIKKVETAVATLVEEQQLPFGIDDALLQLEQCSKILYLIDQPLLGKITQYCAEVMQNIMQNPTQTEEIQSLSEGSALLQRYIEFSTLKEVNIPQFLLESLNRLELALGKPLTREGNQIKPFLECVSPQFQTPEVQDVPMSTHVHALYKICMQQLLKHKTVSTGFIVVGLHLNALAQNTPSAQFWALTHQAFNHLNTMYLDAPRLRVLIQLESLIGQFLQDMPLFNPSIDDVTDVLSLCLTQETELAEQIREKLNLDDDILSDTQLDIFRKQLKSPNYDTVKTISDLLSEEITRLHQEIEYNYTTLSDERAHEIQKHLICVAQTIKLLNLDQTAQPIFSAAQQLTSAHQMKDEGYTQMLMNSLLTALNDLGLYVRQNTSSYLQYTVNNKEIALDRLDNAYETLKHELKALVDLSSSTLVNYIESQDLHTLENLPSQFKEMSGALYFFINSVNAQQAFKNSAEFLALKLDKEESLTTQEIQNLLNVCASADILLESVNNAQPVMFKMFDVALESSQHLKAA